MLSDIDSILQEVDEVLDGINYVVSLQSYCIPNDPAGALATIRSAWDSVGKVLQVEPISSEQVLMIVENSLRYEGTGGGAGPDLARLASSEFDVLVRTILEFYGEKLSSASEVVDITLKHEYVFWQFAFAIVGKTTTEVLVGASFD